MVMHRRSTTLSLVFTCLSALGTSAACPVPPSTPDQPKPDANTDHRVDYDSDGFFASEDDCNDVNAQINPGAIEIVGDGVDNDCNGLIDDHPGHCDCENEGDSSLEEGMAHAMGLCDEWIIGLSSFGNPRALGAFDEWGALRPRTSSDASFIDGLPSQNCRFVILATGPTKSASPRDEELSDLGIYDAPDPSPAPDGAEINDLAQFGITLRIPTNAFGFSFDFIFFSSEYPDLVCSAYNDTFTAVVKDEPLLGYGAPTRISVDRYGNEITVNTSFFEYPPYWSLDISGTGYGIGDTVSWCQMEPIYGCTVPSPCPTYLGSTTGWLRTASPVTPGGEVSLVFSIHDEHDNVWDSAVVIDNFRWLFGPPGNPHTVK